MTLRSYILGNRKTIPRGAVSRVAEYLGVSRERAVAAIMGVNRCPDVARRAQDFVASRQPFRAFKTGGKTKLDVDSILVCYDNGHTLASLAESFGVTGERIRQIVRASGRKPRK